MRRICHITQGQCHYHAKIQGVRTLLEVKDFSSYPLGIKDFSSNTGKQTLPKAMKLLTSASFYDCVGDQAASACLPPGLKPAEAQSRRLLTPMAPRCCVGRKPELRASLAITNAEFCWDSEQQGLLLATESSRLTTTSKRLSERRLSNMEGPRDCHPESSKSEREGGTLHDIPYTWRVERNATNEFTYKTETENRQDC